MTQTRGLEASYAGRHIRIHVNGQEFVALAQVFALGPRRIHVEPRLQSFQRFRSTSSQSAHSRQRRVSSTRV